MLKSIKELRDTLTGDIGYKLYPQTANDVLTEIQETMEKFISDIIMLCDDENTTKEDIKEGLINDSTDKETIKESCEKISWFLESLEDDIDSLEKEAREVESEELFKLYHSL